MLIWAATSLVWKWALHSRLGARLDVVEMTGGLMYSADIDLFKSGQKMNTKRFNNIMLKTKAVSARALPEGIEVTFSFVKEGGTCPAPQVYDLVLQAADHTPTWSSSHRRPESRDKDALVFWASRMRLLTKVR